MELTTTAVCIQNDVEKPVDGGQVRLKLIIPPELKAAGLLMGVVALAFRSDAPMRAFPWLRADMETQEYELVLRSREAPEPPGPGPETPALPAPEEPEA